MATLGCGAGSLSALDFCFQWEMRANGSESPVSTAQEEPGAAHRLVPGVHLGSPQALRLTPGLVSHHHSVNSRCALPRAEMQGLTVVA